MLRVIQELRPGWVIGENVAGLVRTALDEILSSLEEIGYSARAYYSEARNVGGVFRGGRIAIVAASNDRSASLRWDGELPADDGLEGFMDYHGGRTEEFNLRERWEIESRPYGVADGVSNRVDRLRCLGNAVVPQQFYLVFRAIAEIERSGV